MTLSEHLEYVAPELGLDEVERVIALCVTGYGRAEVEVGGSVAPAYLHVVRLGLERFIEQHLRAESAFAHIERESGSMVALCGYRAKRRGTVEEAERTGYCVVCASLASASR
jgi:hypothetical protein